MSSSVLLCPSISPPSSSCVPLPGILRWSLPTEKTLCSCEQKTQRWHSLGTMPSSPALPTFYHEWRRRSGPSNPAWTSSMWAGLRSRCVKGWRHMSSALQEHEKFLILLRFPSVPTFLRLSNAVTLNTICPKNSLEKTSWQSVKPKQLTSE